MPMPRDYTKEQKAQIFKEHTAKYLDAEEAKQVKIALAHFMKNKDPPELVDKLSQVLMTPEKRNMFDTIGLFIPSKFIDEYETLWRGESDDTPQAASTDEQESEAVHAAEAERQRAAEAENQRQEQLRQQEEEAARAREAAAAQEAERARLEEARRETERQKEEQARREEERLEQALQEEARAEEARHEDEKKETPEESAQQEEAQEALQNDDARPEDDSDESQQPNDGGDAAHTAPPKEPTPDTSGEHQAQPEPEPQLETPKPVAPVERPLTQAELEKKRDEARAKRARQREEEAARKKAQEEEQQGAGLMRSRRSQSIMGKKGGVAQMKARMAAANSSEREESAVKFRHEPRTDRKESIVDIARKSHIEQIKKVAREGPVDRTELLVKAEQLAGEKFGGKIVIYTTSVTGILETKVQCKEMRGIFQRLRVRFEERNIYMDKTLSNELEFRLPGAKLPQAFFNGEHLGGFDEILKMNETGHLQKLTKNMEKIEVNITGDCETCAGEGFTLCTWCGGNKRKSMAIQYNVPTRQTAFLKCTACNDNGLMMCPDCMTRPEDAEA